MQNDELKAGRGLGFSGYVGGNIPEIAGLLVPNSVISIEGRSERRACSVPHQISQKPLIPFSLGRCRRKDRN